MRRDALLVACGIALLVSSCAGASVSIEDADAGADPVPTCVAGRSVACACVDGRIGAQVCVAGATFGTCACADAGTDVSTSAAVCVPGESVSCSCSTGAAGARTCMDEGTYSACICETPDAGWKQQRLAWLQAGMVGTWFGSVKNPWHPAFDATVVFDASGHYSAHTPGDQIVVFYYGSNDDSPDNTYQLTEVTSNGEGWGKIRGHGRQSGRTPPPDIERRWQPVGVPVLPREQRSHHVHVDASALSRATGTS